jgi:hypothetical protein
MSTTRQKTWTPKGKSGIGMVKEKESMNKGKKKQLRK